MENQSQTKSLDKMHNHLGLVTYYQKGTSKISPHGYKLTNDAHGFLLRFEPQFYPKLKHLVGGFGEKNPQQSHKFRGEFNKIGLYSLVYISQKVREGKVVSAKNIFQDLCGIVTQEKTIKLLHPSWDKIETRKDEDLNMPGAIVFFQLKIERNNSEITYKLKEWTEFIPSNLEHQNYLKKYLSNILKDTWDWSLIDKTLEKIKPSNIDELLKKWSNLLSNWAKQDISERQEQIPPLVNFIETYKAWDIFHTENLLTKPNNGFTISLFLYDLGGGFSEERRSQLSLELYWNKHWDYWAENLPSNTIPYLFDAICNASTIEEEGRLDKWLEAWVSKNKPKWTLEPKEKEPWGKTLFLIDSKTLPEILNWIGDAISWDAAFFQWVNGQFERLPEEILHNWASKFPVEFIPNLRQQFLLEIDETSLDRLIIWFNIWIQNNEHKNQASQLERSTWESILTHLPPDLLLPTLEWVGDSISPQKILKKWLQGHLIGIPQSWFLDHFSKLSKEDRIIIWSWLTPSETLDKYASSELSTQVLSEELLFWLKDQLIQHNVAICDIEIRKGNLKEWGIWHQNEYLKGNLPQGLATLMAQTAWLAGHNFLEFDLPHLNQFDVDYDRDMIWDTYRIEMILSPDRATYALNTKHEAVADVKHNLELLINQITRIVCHKTEIQKEIIKWLPLVAQKWLEGIIDHPVWEKISTINWDEKSSYFFRVKNHNTLFQEIIKNVDANQKNYFILSKRLWPLIGFSPETFRVHSDGGTDFQTFRLNESVIREKLSANWQGSALVNFLHQKSEKQEIAHWNGLSPALRKYISDLIEEDQIQEPIPFDSLEKLGNHILLTPDSYLKFLQTFPHKVSQTAYLLFPDLSQYWNRILLKEIDRENLLQMEAISEYVGQFSGGRDFIRLPFLPESLSVQRGNCSNFWMEKASQRIYRIWGSFDISNKLGESIKELSWNSIQTSKALAQLTLVSSNSRHSNFFRYNPESNYRDRYWTIQYQLLLNSIQINLPVLWVIELENEVPKLIELLISNGWYVPETNLSLARRIELTQQKNQPYTALIISLEKLFEALPFLGASPWQVWIDSLPLREWFGRQHAWQPIWNSSQAEPSEEIKIEEPESEIIESEEDSDESSSDNIELQNFKVREALEMNLGWIKALQFWLSQLSPENKHQLLIADSRLEDFPILKSWEAKYKKVKIWSKREGKVEYERSLAKTREFFPPKATNIDFNSVEIEKAKKSILRTFVGVQNGKEPEWRPNQLPFIEPILKQENDILVSLPTGGGKSLLFQGPALYRSAFSNRLSIVFTPLKALMEDQALSLWQKGFWTNVDYLNSDRGIELSDILRRLVGGELFLIYVTPERLRSRSFRRALSERIENDQRLEYGIFDEVHCLSQWGHEFRPDYLNSGYVISQLRKDHDYFPLALFSATVSKRMEAQIEDVLTPPQEIQIPSRHVGTKGIKYEFRVVSEGGYITSLAEELESAKVNVVKSRVLIFVRSRRKAENYADQLTRYWNEVGNDLAIDSSKIDFFHAGLNGNEREEKVEKFKNGEIGILFTTKAFGMGMDIPNIHYLFHIQPTGNLEDYLQEVGRAGRDLKSLASANIDQIRAICFLENTDWAKARDLLKKGEMSWRFVVEAQKEIHAYYTKFRKLQPSEHPLPLPLNLLDHNNRDPKLKNLVTHFRLSLYWLERLKRIKLGYYTTSHLVFEAGSIRDEDVPEKKLESIRRILKQTLKSQNGNPERIFVLQSHLQNAAEVKNQRELFRLIFKGHKLHYWQLDRSIKIELTDFRRSEVDWVTDSFTISFTRDIHFLMLKACMSFAEHILLSLPQDQEVDLEDDFIQNIAQTISNGMFRPENFRWVSTDGSTPSEIFKKQNELATKYKQDFFKKRLRASFSFMIIVPTVKHKTIYHQERSKPVQRVYHQLNQDEIKHYLSELNGYCEQLLRKIKQTISQSENPILNLTRLILNLEDYQPSFYHKSLRKKGPDIKALEDGLSILSKLAYIKSKGSLFPRGIELYLRDIKGIGEKELNESELAIRLEFDNVQQQRYLRLMVLQILSMLPQRIHNTLVESYFSCESNEDIFGLIVDYLNKFKNGEYGQEHQSECEHLLQSLQAEALKEAEGGLEEEQRKVYSAPLNQNQLVVAGPGSGKTHTLTLRIAQMIHKQNVQPQQILVLAYNKAVAIEIKARVRNLFRRLGYQNVINGLNVYTFDGFAMKLIPQEARSIMEGPLPANEKFQEILNHVLKVFEAKPGNLTHILGSIKYVLIDEFQDVNELRFKVLSTLFSPRNHFILAIGDPNQSIYGYDREQISPSPMYESFRKKYVPKEFQISVNFRSLPKILTHSERYLSQNKEVFGMGSLSPKRVAPKGFTESYLEEFDYTLHRTKWYQKLKDLLEEKSVDEKPYRQVAIMTRTNAEVFLALKRIKHLELDTQRYRTRIQGLNTGSFLKLREITYLVDKVIQPKWTQPLGKEFKKYISGIIAETQETFPTWDKYLLNLFFALALEYINVYGLNNSGQELHQFIKDLTHREDGQLSQIYNRQKKNIQGDKVDTEIILTTIHKVKGLEYEAAIIPPSFAELPYSMDLEDDCTFTEVIEEERRLRYVAMTRARDRLVIINYEREEALKQGKTYTPSESLSKHLGKPIKENIKNVYLSYAASLNDRNVHDQLEKYSKPGDEIVLRKRPKSPTWLIVSNGYTIGRTANFFKSPFPPKVETIKGLFIANIYQNTLEEAQKAGIDHLWKEWAKKKGYSFYASFSGYAEPA